MLKASRGQSRRSDLSPSRPDGIDHWDRRGEAGVVEDVGVVVQGPRRRRLSERRGHVRDAAALVDEKARIGVPPVVRRSPHPGAVARRLPDSPPPVPEVEVAASCARRRSRADQGILLPDLRPQQNQVIGQGRDHLHRAPTVGLRRLQLAFRVRAVHHQHWADGRRPSQREDLLRAAGLDVVAAREGPRAIVRFDRVLPSGPRWSGPLGRLAAC